MDLKTIEAVIRNHESIAFGPKSYLPYIWVDVKSRLLRFTSDTKDCVVPVVGHAIEKFLTIGVPLKITIQFHRAISKQIANGGRNLDYDMAFKFEDKKNLPQVIKFIQDVFFEVKNWIQIPLENSDSQQKQPTNK